MKMNEHFVGKMKTDAIELINTVENYFLSNKDVLVEEILVQGLSLEEAYSILHAAKKNTIKEVLEQYLALYKAHQHNFL